jgi:hypothetical protein
MTFLERSRLSTAPVTSLHHFVALAMATKRCMTYSQVCSRPFLTLILNTRDCTMPTSRSGRMCVTGTRRSPFAGVPPTGRRIEVPLVANFDFDGDLLIGEKVNFDLSALIQQLQA